MSAYAGSAAYSEYGIHFEAERLETLGKILYKPIGDRLKRRVGKAESLMCELTCAAAVATMPAWAPASSCDELHVECRDPTFLATLQLA